MPDKTAAACCYNYVIMGDIYAILTSNHSHSNILLIYRLADFHILELPKSCLIFG